MRVPAIAKKTFDKFKNESEYIQIVHDTLAKLKKISAPFKRAKQLHKIVDEFMAEVLSDKLVQELSPCTMGCSNCCHTEVSITADEAALLARKIGPGFEIDYNLLRKQSSLGPGQQYMSLPFEDRRCVFLSDEGACRVYADRPSVCRTNAVLGEKNQCDTRDTIKPIRLVNTAKADMAIYAAFYLSETSGILPEMLNSALVLKEKSPSCSE